ncbi:MAG: Uracil phosphoribosyltransferase [Alphaproteobacteria bacterium MarineAlpha11_Bin1]|nr:MAG: Uracil phosphoribosyltransferase [Alphaproteobacteria bacterium MarineAlpha11_Bin1]
MEKKTNASVEVVDHPLIQHKLTMIRDQGTGAADFRQLLREISHLLAYEVCRDFETETVTIETPLEVTTGPKLEGRKLCIISILRAGNGLLDGMLDLIPAARVGHIGLYRDPDTKVPVEYYLKLPDNLNERRCIVVDPMLATGGSAIAAVHRLKQCGAERIKFVCVVAAPEGLKAFTQAHPDVQVITSAIDRELDDDSYIRPGLGDAGDRMFGTK